MLPVLFANRKKLITISAIGLLTILAIVIVVVVVSKSKRQTFRTKDVIEKELKETRDLEIKYFHELAELVDAKEKELAERKSVEEAKKNEIDVIKNKYESGEKLTEDESIKYVDLEVHNSGAKSPKDVTAFIEKRISEMAKNIQKIGAELKQQTVSAGISMMGKTTMGDKQHDLFNKLTNEIQILYAYRDNMKSGKYMMNAEDIKRLNYQIANATRLQ